MEKSGEIVESGLHFIISPMCFSPSPPRILAKPTICCSPNMLHSLLCPYLCTCCPLLSGVSRSCLPTFPSRSSRLLCFWKAFLVPQAGSISMAPWACAYISSYHTVVGTLACVPCHRTANTLRARTVSITFIPQMSLA